MKFGRDVLVFNFMRKRKHHGRLRIAPATCANTSGFACSGIASISCYDKTGMQRIAACKRYGDVIAIVAIFDCRLRDAFNCRVVFNRFRKLLVQRCIGDVVAKGCFIDFACAECYGGAADQTLSGIDNTH